MKNTNDTLLQEMSTMLQNLQNSQNSFEEKMGNAIEKSEVEIKQYVALTVEKSEIEFKQYVTLAIEESQKKVIKIMDEKIDDMYYDLKNKINRVEAEQYVNNSMVHANTLLTMPGQSHTLSSAANPKVVPTTSYDMIQSDIYYQ